jgi:hypothetical protein
MCVSSLGHKNVPVAQAKTVYAITRMLADDGRPHAVLHEPGRSALTTMVCAQKESVMTLTNIPQDLQYQYGVEDLEVVIFRGSPDGIKKDVIELKKNGMRFCLAGFAGRKVKAYIGELERPQGFSKEKREEICA